jgi:hypothetical protein
LNTIPAYYSLALAPVLKSFRLLPKDFLAHFEEILFFKAVFTLEKFFGKKRLRSCADFMLLRLL